MLAFARSMTGRVFFYIFTGVVVAFVFAAYLASLSVHHPFVIVAYVIAIFGLSYVVARVATAPLAQLASAAQRLENDIESAPMSEDGPTEVRQAATAFNAMQARIARDVRERTSMLAAITHDLQTPVTRLRLRLEKVTDDALRAKLVADLDAMRATIREGLDLATSLDTRQPFQPIDLDSMLESVVADACDAGHDATLQGRTHRFVLGSPNGVRRCLTNLLDNAVKYGGYARVECASDANQAVVYIRDGGPGIPEREFEQVFQPFVRVENSRSRETGGTGIGLTIARNIMTRMRGKISLRNHPEGGLEVRLELPADRTVAKQQSRNSS